ncbi:hypothetical protein BDR26DRAFT_849668, partial [Obelidium mucronatum]
MPKMTPYNFKSLQNYNKHMKLIPVTIVTDTLCPWCYIGKKRFERAVANVSGAVRCINQM